MPGGGFRTFVYRRLGYRRFRTHAAAPSQPVTGYGVLALIAGDNYYPSESRQLQFVDASKTWPSLAGATVIFHAKDHTGQSTLTLSAEVISTSAPEEVDVTVPRAATEPLLDGPYEYDLVAVLADGHELSLYRGPLTIAHQTEGRFP